MLTPRSRMGGFTLVELLVTLVVAAILVGVAGPRLSGGVDALRARAALDLIAAELYRARMLAAEGGYPVRLVLHGGGTECAHEMTTSRYQAVGEPTLLTRAAFDLPGLCLRHTGDSILVFDGRGMLRPPARSFFIEDGAVSERLVLSIAGRLRRTQ
jgi:prepilin-type N-terminal cleavage/methylation domain-containing protein